MCVPFHLLLVLSRLKLYMEQISLQLSPVTMFIYGTNSGGGTNSPAIRTNLCRLICKIETENVMLQFYNMIAVFNLLNEKGRQLSLFKT